MLELTLRNRELPVGSLGRKSSGWYGVWTLVLTEASIFAYLLFSYFYLASQAGDDWPVGGPPSLELAAPNTVILLLSSAALIWAERSGARRAKRWQLLSGIGLSFVLGVIFVIVQLREWRNKPFSIHSGTYGSSYFMVTGFHLAHVIVGLILLLALFTWALLGMFDRERHAPLTIGAIYWHFVDVVWLIVFTALYLVPRLAPVNPTL
jgi:heme/copper-type cytochrome/quinol oxidase subunit 3